MQKFEIVNGILKSYSDKAPIHKKGLSLLYERAENRGYRPNEIYLGLKTCILKNYIREEYVPPNNDPAQEPLDERIFIEDWEFREIFNTGGNSNG